jgi:proline iminopeptidase
VDFAEPHESGFLDVGDGHRVWWQATGNPDGTPVVMLHGGPGGAIARSTGHPTRTFDPERWRFIRFHQRSCGLSTPHPGDGLVDLSTNTTAHLIADIEMLREQVGVDRWVVFGGSWGTTLGLAYAEEHPDRVSAMLLAAVVTTSAAEVEWVTRSMRRVFPAEWERFADGLDGNLAAAYARLLADSDPAVRNAAAIRWCEWEDTHVATAPDYTHDKSYDDPRFRLAFATLVTHYWANAAFLPDGALLANVERIAHIPAVLVHGRLDISGPPDVAWALAQRWPAAELVLVNNAGHGGDPITEALAAAATRLLP